MPKPNPISNPHRMRARRLNCGCSPDKTHLAVALRPHEKAPCGCLCHYPKKFQRAIDADRKARCGRINP